MTLTDKIESSTHSLNRHGAAGHPNEAGNREQDEVSYVSWSPYYAWD